MVKLRATAHGLRPDDRAEHAAAILEEVGPNPRIASKGTTVIANGRTLLSVVRADSLPFRMRPAGLAKVWAAKIQKAVALPPLSVEQTALMLPGGTTHTVRLYGYKANDAIVDSSDEQVVKVQKVTNGFLATAMSPGHATVTASVVGAIKSIPVDVKPYAANFPQRVDAIVTGAPANKETVLGAVENAVHNTVKAALGTDTKILLCAPEDVPSGESRVFTCRVKAYGMESITSEGQVQVRVKNIALPQKEDAELWYCNNPESIKRLGALFSASLIPDEPARLLYHHENSSGRLLVLKVQAVNDSEQVARIMIIPGDSKPDSNPVAAGLKAADQFVRSWKCGSGEIVSIPPHYTLPISVRKLYPGQTASGLCTLRLLDGPPSLLIRADAREPFAVDTRWAAALRSSTPWRIVGTQHIREFDAPARTLTDQIYPHPYELFEADYHVGGPFAFIRIGQKPISRRDKMDKLQGNFGVVYKGRAIISNPTEAPVDVEVVFESSAGYSGALCILNGDLVKTPILRPKGEYRLLKLHLAGQASQTMELTTVPLSGSSYPATITIRPVGSNARFGTTPVAERGQTTG